MFLVHNVLYYLLKLLKQAQTVYLTKVFFNQYIIYIMYICFSKISVKVDILFLPDMEFPSLVIQYLA